MISPAYQIREKLCKYGYNYCTENYEQGTVLTPDEFMDASNDSPAVMAAARAYQRNFSTQLDTLTAREIEHGGYGRLSVPDGEARSCTHELLMSARCGVPDYRAVDGPEEVAIPDACRGNITMSYDPRMRLSGIDRDRYGELFMAASQVWANAIDVDFQLTPDYPRSMIHFILANLPGGVLADMWLWPTDSCNNDVEGRIDNRSWEWDYLLTVLAHELGHAQGAVHSPTNGALMYPSITSESVARKGVPIEADLRIMDELGYNRRNADEYRLVGTHRIKDANTNEPLGIVDIDVPVTTSTPLANRMITFESKDKSTIAGTGERFIFSRATPVPE